MLSELMQSQLALLASEENKIFVNDSNAQLAGIDITELRKRFYSEKGRVILTNENIKVLFDKEGGHLDFTTFDDVTVRVDFNTQRVAPNKGQDGFE